MLRKLYHVPANHYHSSEKRRRRRRRFAIEYTNILHIKHLRYIDILPKFLTAYNDTVHSTTSMAHSRVTDSDGLAKWKRMEAARKRSVSVANATFRVGRHVRITKEKMRSAKFAEQNFSTEIFRVAKVIEKGRERSTGSRILTARL